MKQVQFDWNTAHGSPERIKWLRENCNKPITEDEYVEHVKQLPHNRSHASKCRTPSDNRRKYRYLKARFGFFGGIS